MSGHAFNLSISFESLTCCECGIEYAGPSYFFTKRRENHASFYCPNGHAQHFPAETEAERLKRQLADEQARHSRTLARLNASERTAKKLDRQVKRTKKGCCPCCNRYFQNLARHVATKHPTELPTPPPPTLP